MNCKPINFFIMKKIRIAGLLLVLLMMILSVPKIYAQADASRFESSFVITDTSGVSYTFSAPSTQTTTPSGNMLKTFKIKIPKGHPLMQNFGAYPNRYFAFVYILEDNGEEGYNPEDGDIVLFDGIAKLNKSGNLSIDFHGNGAGNYLPKGW